MNSSEYSSPPQVEQAKINEVRKLIGPLSGNLAICCTDASISRYLKARNWNVKKAVKMLKATLKWREEFKPEEICWLIFATLRSFVGTKILCTSRFQPIEFQHCLFSMLAMNVISPLMKETFSLLMIMQDDIAEEAETGKIYISNYKDKMGRPVLVMRPRCQNSKSIKGQIKYLVYCMENAILDLPPDQEQMIWLIDFQGFNLSHISIKVTRETAHVLQEHYPERLGIAILYNAPKIFQPFWMVAKPFLEPKTANKVNFVYADDPNTSKIMNELFDMEMVESAFGGKDDLDFNITKYAERMREEDKRSLSFWKTPSENLISETESEKSDGQQTKSSSTGDEDKNTSTDGSV